MVESANGLGSGISGGLEVSISTVDDARWFLESAWHAGETLYAAFVLILVLGLRKGEVLGITWEIDLDAETASRKIATGR